MNMCFWYKGENNFIVQEEDYSLVSTLLPKSSMSICAGAHGDNMYFLCLVAGSRHSGIQCIDILS